MKFLIKRTNFSEHMKRLSLKKKIRKARIRAREDWITEEDVNEEIESHRREGAKKVIVAQTAGLLSDMDMSGKEYVESIRKGSGRRLKMMNRREFE